MKLIIFIPLSTGVSFTCHSNEKQNFQTTTKSENALIGKWVRIGQFGPVGFEFKTNGLIEGDFWD